MRFCYDITPELNDRLKKYLWHGSKQPVMMALIEKLANALEQDGRQLTVKIIDPKTKLEIVKG